MEKAKPEGIIWAPGSRQAYSQVHKCTLGTSTFSFCFSQSELVFLSVVTEKILPDTHNNLLVLICLSLSLVIEKECWSKCLGSWSQVLCKWIDWLFVAKNWGFCELVGVSQTQDYFCNTDKMEAPVPVTRHRLWKVSIKAHGWMAQWEVLSGFIRRHLERTPFIPGIHRYSADYCQVTCIRFTKGDIW